MQDLVPLGRSWSLIYHKWMLQPWSFAVVWFKNTDFKIFHFFFKNSHYLQKSMLARLSSSVPRHVSVHTNSTAMLQPLSIKRSCHSWQMTSRNTIKQWQIKNLVLPTMWWEWIVQHCFQVCCMLSQFVKRLEDSFLLRNFAFYFTVRAGENLCPIVLGR